MKPSSTKNLKTYRKTIDTLDAQILELLAKRGVMAQKIGKIKKSQQLEVYVPSREKQVFSHIRELNAGPYSDSALFAIYREIISATRALEEPTCVAFLGPLATFTHQAAKHHFGQSTEYLQKNDISAVFDAVEKGHADYGVVPIENSTEGVVNYTLDRFIESDLKICSEVILPVVQNLLSKESRIQNVTKIYSHPQAFAQCRKWLLLNLPLAKLIEVESTAKAAEIAAKQKKSAAIASVIAADLYGLHRLQTAIQDEHANFTRFLVIGSASAGRTGKDKTSVAFVGKHRSGVLHDLLKPFAKNRVNLTKIESRPLKKRVWHYMFFVDMDGHLSDNSVQKSLQELTKHCENIKILGSYPKA